MAVRIRPSLPLKKKPINGVGLEVLTSGSFEQCVDDMLSYHANFESDIKADIQDIIDILNPKDDDFVGL